jgi:acid phosphatase
MLSSLGAFEGEPWPPYTSHIALELFRKSNIRRADATQVKSEIFSSANSKKGWFGNFLGSKGSMIEEKSPPGIARKKVPQLSEADRRKLDGYFVRIRYNDKVMNVPGCQSPGDHLEGDESFCTLVRQTES